jgi:hypothetical protein
VSTNNNLIRIREIDEISIGNRIYWTLTLVNTNNDERSLSYIHLKDRCNCATLSLH